MKPLSASVVSLRRSGIREVMDLAFAHPRPLRLEVGDPDFPTPPHIIEAAEKAAAAGYTHYTPSRGLGEVREAMADKIVSFNGIDVNADDVVVTAGSGHGLFSVCRALCDPGDQVLIPDPGWPNYRTIASLVGIEPIPYPLPAEGGFLPDLEQLDRLAAEAPRAKALILNSPSNPTGAVWPRPVLEAVAEVCARHDLYLISDECYEAITFEGEHHSPAAFDDGRTISVFTVSKTYAMTGWRIGYLVGPREVTDAVGKVVENTVSCASAVSQKAAEAALRTNQAPVAAMVDAYRKRRDLALHCLAAASLPAVRPGGAFYVMVSVPTTDTMQFARSLVAATGVTVAPGDTFGTESFGMVRISLASAEATIEEGIARMGEFCR